MTGNLEEVEGKYRGKEDRKIKQSKMWGQKGK